MGKVKPLWKVSPLARIRKYFELFKAKTRAWFGVYVAGAVLGLILLELVCRLFLPQPGFEEFTRVWPKGVISPHPTRGFTYTPGYTGELVSERGVPYTIRINDRGFRDSDGVDGRASPEILTLGDSITFGWGVEEPESWPSRLETILNRTQVGDAKASVYNAGTSGYNVDQNLDVARELFDDVRPDIVILALLPRGNYTWATNPYTYYKGYRIQRNNTSLVVVKDNGVITSQFEMPELQRFDLWLKENFYVGAFMLDIVRRAKRSGFRVAAGFSSSGDYDAVKHVDTQLGPLWASLLDLKAYVEAQGAVLITVVIPLQELDGALFQPDVAANYVARTMEFCRAQRMNCISLLDAFKSFEGDVRTFALPGDFHWSRAGHDYAAHRIADYLQEHELPASN